MENDRKFYYANAVNMAISLYDVTFVLRNQSPQIDPEGNLMVLNNKQVIDVSEEIVIRMSPQHAKAFAILLVKNIAEYEKNFGIKLPITPDLQKLWDENIKSE